MPSGRTIELLYEEVCHSPNDMNPHLPTLRFMAHACDSVTEFGVRNGVSTTALAAAKPKSLLCVDINCACKGVVDLIAGLVPETVVDFLCVSTLEIDIPETDLLFIDTTHTYEHLLAELTRHSGRVKHYILLHDTEQPDMMAAVTEFCARGEFRLLTHSTKSYGLTVLERCL